MKEPFSLEQNVHVSAVGAEFGQICLWKERISFSKLRLFLKKIKESSFLVHISQIFKIRLNNEILKSSFIHGHLKKTI